MAAAVRAAVGSQGVSSPSAILRRKSVAGSTFTSKEVSLDLSRSAKRYALPFPPSHPRLHASTQRTATLLAHFGLRTLTDTALSDVEDPFIKSDCFTPVSLLPLSTPSTVLTPSTSIPIYAEDPNTSHTAVDLASALESLPSNAPVRFRELLRLFPLSNSYPGVHNARVKKEYDEKKIKEAQEKGGKGGKASQEAKEKAEEIVVRKEAGWHLWGDGSSVSGW